MRLVLASILFLGSSTLAFADVESGPKAGDKVAPLKVHAVSGPIEDKEVDFAKERKDEPTIYAFVNGEKFTRPVARYLKALDGKVGDGGEKAKVVIVWTGGEFDNELTTDLTAVHFGLGIFIANKERGLEARHGKWAGTDLLRPEYMNPPMFGWALAHLAWFRGEDAPAWARYLHSGARANLKQGIRYLKATADTSYPMLRLRRE